jgi:hypothetical protein
MRPFPFLVTIACISSLSLQAVAQVPKPSRAMQVLIPKGTPIVIETYNEINSATFHTGERLAYKVTNDVIVRGAVVARAGDLAGGVVQDAQQGHKAHAGTIGAVAGPAGAVAGAAVNKMASQGANLRISADHVKTFCGDTIPLDFVRSEYHRPKKLHPMTTVEIAKGQKYVALVADDLHVCGTATTATPAPIPADALQGDSP